MDGFARASEPGAFWVDSFPLCECFGPSIAILPLCSITVPLVKYVPAWFPGASFQRVARSMRQDLERLYDVPFNYVKQQLEYSVSMFW